MMNKYLEREREWESETVSCFNSASLCIYRGQKNLKHWYTVEWGKRKSLTWEHKHSKHPCQDDETYRVVHPSWAVLIWISLLVLQMRTLWFFFRSSLFPQRQFFIPLCGLVEDALNPVQIVVGSSHRERLAPHAESVLPFSLILQHTEKTSTMQDWGEGSHCSAGIGWSFCQSPFNSPSSISLFTYIYIYRFYLSLFFFLWQNENRI